MQTQRYAASDRRTCVFVTLECLALLVLFLLTLDHTFPDSDVASADTFAWHLVNTGSVWADNLPTGTTTSWYLTPLWLTQHAGHLVISRSPGVLVAPIPAYAIQRLLGLGGATASAVPGAITAAVLTAVSMWLLMMAVAGLVRRTVLLAAGALIALSTPIWSVLADAMWPHDVTVLGIAGMAWAARRERWLLVGLFGGIGLWGRLHVALIVAILGLGVALWRRRPSIAVRVGLGSLPLLLLASWWSWRLYGHLVPSGGYDATTIGTNVGHTAVVSDAINLLGLLVSPGRGLLVWTPALLALAPGVVRAWRTTPDWTRALALGGVAYLVVQGLIDSYTGGSFFYGYRLPLETLACAAPLLVLSLRHVRPGEGVVLAALTGLQLGAISLGAIANGPFIPGTEDWHDSSLFHQMHTAPLCIPYLAVYTLIGLGIGIRLRQLRLAQKATPPAVA